MSIGTKILVVNRVGTLMEVRANTQGDLDFYHISLIDKSKFLSDLVKSTRNYKTQAIIIGEFNKEEEPS